MTQVVVGGPLEELELSDEHRLDEAEPTAGHGEKRRSETGRDSGAADWTAAAHGPAQGSSSWSAAGSLAGIPSRALSALSTP
jgi:hypothetical protein